MRIAILFHANERGTPLSWFLVDHLARFWRQDGHEVVYLFGVKKFVPADLLLVHVDLSVVPEEYLAFAARYPVSLNSGIADIRKSVVSTNVVKHGDAYTGPVIVKSNLNFGGQPEERLSRSWLQKRFELWRRVGQAARRFTVKRPPKDLIYPVFDSLAEVPATLLGREDLIVERFLPERENDLFHMRMCLVLGDRCVCRRVASPEPAFKAFESVSSEVVEEHPEVAIWREKFRLDYGKLDYLVHDGRPILIDINKTTGAVRQVADSPFKATRRELADGIYHYFR